MDIHDYFHDASEKLVIALTVPNGDDTRLDGFLRVLKDIIIESRNETLARVIITACLPVNSEAQYGELMQGAFSVLSAYEDAEIKKLEYRQGTAKVSIDYDRYIPEGSAE